MRVLKSSILWGMVLIIAGGLLLLEALGVLGTPLIWSAILGAAGAAFIYTFFKSRDLYWWAAIPGFGLLGPAATTAWDQLEPASLEERSAVLGRSRRGLLGSLPGSRSRALVGADRGRALPHLSHLRRLWPETQATRVSR
jgi:hypothetical protein